METEATELKMITTNTLLPTPPRLRFAGGPRLLSRVWVMKLIYAYSKFVAISSFEERVHS